MKKNTFETLTNEELVKKAKLLKGVFIGFMIIFIIAISALMYVLGNKGFKNVSIATFVPFFILPVTFVPILINLSLVNKEIKARNV